MRAPTIDFNLVLDCRKAKNEIGWKSQVNLSDGIKNCDIAISLVDHKEFTEIKRLDFNGKILIDSKGIWN